MGAFTKTCLGGTDEKLGGYPHNLRCWKGSVWKIYHPQGGVGHLVDYEACDFIETTI